MEEKIERLFSNWNIEKHLAAGEPQHVLESIDAFYQPYTQRYLGKRLRLQQHLEQEEKSAKMV